MLIDSSLLSRQSSLQFGAFCESYVKTVLQLNGMSTYTADVDDHGIDFIAEYKKRLFKFQVKSIRFKTSYVYANAKYFDVQDESLFLALVIYRDVNSSELPIFLIPAKAWDECSNSKLLVYHAYEKKKSAPEYGLNISKRNMDELYKYSLKNMMSSKVFLAS